MFLILRFLMSFSGDAGNVRGKALGQVMGLQMRVYGWPLNCWHCGQNKEVTSELWGLRGEWRSR